MVQASLSQSKVEASKAIQEASGSDDPAYVKTSIVTQVELLYGLKCDLQNALVLHNKYPPISGYLHFALASKYPEISYSKYPVNLLFIR